MQRMFGMLKQRLCGTNNDAKSEAKTLPAAFKRLTGDTELLPLTFLNYKDIQSVTLVSQGMHRVAGNEEIWRHLYQRDFGFTPFRYDFQLQYTAHHYYREYKNCKRQDIYLIVKDRAIKFILKYQDRPWAWYLGGLMEFHSGKDLRKGARLLKQAFQQGDSRAGAELISRFDIKTDLPGIQITLKEGEAVFNSLLEAVKKPENIGLNYRIAQTYMKGILTEKNFEAAEKCLEVLFEYNPSNEAVLFTLKNCYLREVNPFSVKKKIKKSALEKLENLFQKYKLPIIAIQIGFLQSEHFYDDEAALQWFSLAAYQGSADAEFRVGYSFQNGRGVAENLEYAKHWYRRAWHTNRDPLAVDCLYKLCEEKESQSLVWQKRCYLTSGSKEAYRRLITQIMQHEIKSAEDIWWMQMGKHKKLSALAEKNVFASCALWFIAAQEAFLKGVSPPVCSVSKEVFEKYIQAGKAEELWHPVYEVLYRDFGFEKDAKAVLELKR